MRNANLENQDKEVQANRTLSTTQLNQIEELKKCQECTDISALEIDYPDEPHHGGIRYCGECNAEYYETYGEEKHYAGNEQAKINHPNLETI